MIRYRDKNLDNMIRYSDKNIGDNMIRHNDKNIIDNMIRCSDKNIGDNLLRYRRDNNRVLLLGTLQLYLSTRQNRGAYFSGFSDVVAIWLIWVGKGGYKHQDSK